MVYLGRAKYSQKTGVYIPIIVAENIKLQDGDLIEFHIEEEELILRKSVIAIIEGDLPWIQKR